jgi:catalase
MSKEQQQVLFENTARQMAGVPKEIQVRHITHCYKADPEYGKGVAAALGIAMSDVPV